MRLVWALIPLILIGIVGFQESFAEEENQDLWFVGKDLNFHDYYKYKICTYDDENICKSFDLSLWVKSDSIDKWIFEVMVNDTNKKIRGQIDLDKNSLAITSNDEIKKYLNPIRDFFNSYNIAPRDNPQNFNNTNWKNTFSGNREINLELSNAYFKNSTGQVYSLESKGGILFTNEPISLSETIPFPIKANYTIFDQDFIQFNDQRTCNDGGVLVKKINENSNQCINFKTAYQWAETGLLSMPNVGFELIEWQKHSNFIPSFLQYDPSIDDDVKLTYGTRVLYAKTGVDTPLPIPPNGTTLGIGLFVTHSEGISINGNYLDSDGNLKQLHYSPINGKSHAYSFDIRNITKIWAEDAYFGGLVELRYVQLESEFYHGDYPKVDAGSDQTITNQKFVTLNGSKTIHPLGNNMTYQWGIVNSNIFLNTTSFDSPVVTFPTSEIKTSGSATFRLSVSDERLEHLRNSDDVLITFDLSPLTQINNGVNPSEVTCNDNLTLILKLTNNSPACVKPETANEMIKRDWLVPDLPTTQSSISKVAVTNVCNPIFKNKIIPETIHVILNVTSTVQWTNYGSCGQIIEHIIEYGVSDKEKTKRIYGGDSDTITYFEKGTYHYQLQQYPMYKGTVIVK